MSQFLHNDDAKAIAIPSVFSENSRAKKCWIQLCFMYSVHQDQTPQNVQSDYRSTQSSTFLLT